MEDYKDKLKEDIVNLYDAIVKERNYLREVRIPSVCGNIHNEETYTLLKCETFETKNYTTYRKLICSLFDLIRAYEKLNNGYYDGFIKRFTDSLATEIDSIHNLMKDALNRRNNEQYRCLNSVYCNMLEGIKRIEDIYNY